MLKECYQLGIRVWPPELCTIPNTIYWRHAQSAQFIACCVQGFHERWVRSANTNPFGRNEAGKTIENTINRGCKTKGGFKGFSTNFLATQRWVLNTSRRSAYKKIVREQLTFNSDTLYVNKELAPARVKSDNLAVEKVVYLIENVFKNPWIADSEFICLTTGIAAWSEIRHDLIHAKDKGCNACKNFIENHCSSESTADFFGPITKMRLKSFKDLRIVTKVTA